MPNPTYKAQQLSKALRLLDKHCA